MKVGQYLFRLHGGKIVFLGRFFAVLRLWAALLAGAKSHGLALSSRVQYSWRDSLWATIYGFGAYYLGHELEHVTKLTVAPALGVIGILGVDPNIYPYDAARGRTYCESGSGSSRTNNAKAKALDMSFGDLMLIVDGARLVTVIHLDDGYTHAPAAYTG